MNDTLLLQNVLDRLDRIERKLDGMVTRREYEEGLRNTVSKPFFAGVVATLTLVLGLLAILARFIH